jgi:predicted neuraminidase
MNRIALLLFATSFLLNSYAQQVYTGSEAIVSSEFIYQKEDVTFPSCHASTVAETPKGLIAAWFGGLHENHREVGIWFSTQVNGKWTVPVEIADGIQNENLRYPTWNPVLFVNGNEIKLFYKVGPNCADWWGEMKSSNDNGKTWSKSTKLPENIYGPIKNKPILLKSGDLLCPSSTENHGWRVHMERTPDMGVTWKRTIALNNRDSTEAIQPTILIHPEGKLQILCRTKSDKIYSSFSTDNGLLWTKLEPIGLPNPNSGIDAVTMHDGRHLLVYNHIDVTLMHGKRNMLNVAISKDGINWEAAVLLENDQDTNGEYSYPAVIQGSNGLIHITYTWNRKLIRYVVLDPAKIKTKPMVNGNWPEL